MPHDVDAVVARRPLAHRVVGIVGNCQAELLQQTLSRIAPVSRVNSFYHFFDLPPDKLEPARADLAACDVLLVQDIGESDHYFEQMSVAPRTRIVRFPCLRFASFWPYDDFNGMRDNAARAQDVPSSTLYYDGALGRLRRRVPEPQARFEAYRALAAEGLIDPRRVHGFEERRLEALDSQFGCRLGAFILSAYRNRQLFYAVNRPCGILLKMLFDDVIERLGFDLRSPPAAEFDALRSIQIPVHPIVAQRLGLTWADATTRYEVSGRTMTWEDYARSYIARYG